MFNMLVWVGDRVNILVLLQISASRVVSLEKAGEVRFPP